LVIKGILYDGSIKTIVGIAGFLQLLAELGDAIAVHGDSINGAVLN
jgi:hypothetical protein